MKIAYNPKTAAALTLAPANNDITFDLSGLSIYVRGERFKGTDTTYTVFKKHDSGDSGGYDGLVPVPNYNGNSLTRYLREDGTWLYATDVKLSEATDTDFRPIVLGLTHSAILTELVNPVTGQVYVTSKIYACPSTGILYATKLYSNGKEVLTEHQSLADYVTLNTPLTITGRKTFYSLVNITNGTTNDDGTLYTRPIIYMDSSLYMIYSDTKSHTIICGSAIRIQTSNSVDTVNILPDTIKTLAKIESDQTIKGTLLISTETTNSPLVVSSSAVVAKLNSDLLDGYHANGLFEELDNDGNNLSVTIGGTTKNLIVNYAAQSGKLGYSIKFKNVSYLDVTFDGSKDIDLTGGIYYSLNSDYAKLLKINSTSTSTIATSVGTWTPISGKEYVFRQKWTNSAASSDTADLAIYLDGNLTANMCLDGYYYSLSGFKKSGSDDNYVLLGGGGHKTISSIITSGYIGTTLVLTSSSIQRITGINGIHLVENSGISFRESHSGYYTTLRYDTYGNEALILGMKNAVTSFIIKSGDSGTTNNTTTTFNSLTPSILVKGLSLYVNSLIANDTTPGYNFFVSGTSKFTNTIRISTTTGNYCEGIRLQCSDGLWLTIILGAIAETGTNTYAWSIHRKADNNFCISRNSSDGANGLLIDTSGRVGIGTTSPSYKLDVNGDTRILGNLLVGANTSNNYIAFYGNTGDDPGSYATTFIGEHLWGSPESTELLLMKFNDVGNGTDATTVYLSGPDRIRHLAHGHVFQIMTNTTQGDFATMANSTAVETKFDIARYQLHAYAPLAIISDGTNSGYDGLVYMRHYSNNDWGLIVDKSQSYSYGVDIRAGGTYALKVGNGNTRLIGATIIGEDATPSFTLDVRGNTRSTGRIYANEWIQFDNATGLYWPNTYGAHFYPNDTSSYGQFRLAGSKTGYSGIHFGSGTGYLTVMDNGNDKGAYQLNWNWLWYFNARNGKFSIRTSSDFGADINLNGSVRTNSTYYGYGLYHLSYGSADYLLTSNGGARYWPDLYDGRYLRYEGWWTSGSGQNVDNALGMVFSYTNHGAPHYWGTTVTFESSRNSSYRLQLHGTGDNYLYFRNRSADYGGWHSSGWKQILTNQDTYVASDGTNRGIINGAEVASARHLLINGVTWNSNWYWSGLGGQPTWLWGSNNGSDMYVWNPSNFSVNYANSAGSARCIYTGSCSGDTHAVALQNYFNSNKSTVPRNSLISMYSSAYSNGSLYFGYYLSGYENNPYGGFYVAHYSTPYYVGISNGSFWLQLIITSGTIGSQSVNYATYSRYVYCTSGSYLNFQWSGLSGQPTWLFGSNDGANVYVWNPRNFSVNYASSAGTASKLSTNAGSSANPVYFSGGIPVACDYSFKGLSTQPVVLVSGYFYRNYLNLNTWYFSGYKHSEIGSPIFSVNGGVMTLTFSNTVNVYFISACALSRLNFSGRGNISTTLSASNTEYSWRSEGAYWFNTYVSNSSKTSYLYIRSFRMTDKNNDSWGSYSSSWKLEDDAIHSVSFTIFGYI